MKKCKIILLDPLASGKGLFKHRHFLRDWSGSYNVADIAFPPLDLMYAAAYLRKFDIDVQIIEASIKHMPHKEVVRDIQKTAPDFVFIPTTYFSLDDDKYLACLIRNCNKTIKIIFGGPLVTYNPSLVLSDNTADFVALGELELPLLNIIKGNFSQNIAHKKNRKVVSGQRCLLDLYDLPIPARDLTDTQAYKYAIFNRKNPSTVMTISRGCPHSMCKFCPSKLYTLGEMRYRREDSIFEEINEIVFKYKIGDIFFRDQVFTADRQLVYKICEYLIKNEIDISWRATTRVDLVDKELLVLMRRAGCYQLSFGFESASQQILDINEKGIRVEQSIKAAQWTKEAGIEILGLFMTGMLGDTKENIGQLSRFALDLDVDYVSINDYLLFPGTQVFEEYVKDKSITLPIRLMKQKGLSPVLKFYLRPKYLMRQLTNIRSKEELCFFIKSGINIFLSEL